MPAYRLDPLGQTAVEVQLDEGRLALTYGSAAVFADPPEKAASMTRNFALMTPDLPATIWPGFDPHVLT